MGITGRKSVPVAPENSIRPDWRSEAESAHHYIRWSRSSACLQYLSPICSSLGGGLKPRSCRPSGLVPLVVGDAEPHEVAEVLARLWPGGRLVRTIGTIRARAKIGLQNLVYNIRRLTTLERMAAA